MIVYLNGRFMAEEEAVVSILDRGFLYGDGLFEAIRVYNGHLFLWDGHWERLAQGLEVLRLVLPVSPGDLKSICHELLRSNQRDSGLLRITLSRGRGPRGYSPKNATEPTLAISLHALPIPPPTWTAVISTHILPAHDPLAGFKHLNKLKQVLAKGEAEEAGADEAILLNSDGHLVEGTSTNFFWIEHGVLCTAPLGAGILSGTTRSFILSLASTLNIPTVEKHLRPNDLSRIQGAFVTSCGIEIIELASLNAISLPPSLLVQTLRCAYRQHIQTL